LTTGGLPTFSEITKSFSAGVLEEDNIIDQILVNDRSGKGGKMTFVGDDTWVSLFPTQFTNLHPYPSFNTRDLDTVDNGCMEWLPEMLAESESTR